ncbi:hypothetical protein DER45DRAFT_534341 [Fusarium avenaceum]|nr:hypothetical protein DER45DRAFT_534341 [Fusarium avenaceum]
MWKKKDSERTNNPCSRMGDSLDHLAFMYYSVNKGPGWCRSLGSLVELVRDGVYLNRTVRPLDNGAGLLIDEKDHDARDNPSLKKKLWIMRILKLETDVVEPRKGTKRPDTVAPKKAVSKHPVPDLSQEGPITPRGWLSLELSPVRGCAMICRVKRARKKKRRGKKRGKVHRRRWPPVGGRHIDASYTWFNSTLDLPSPSMIPGHQTNAWTIASL